MDMDLEKRVVLITGGSMGIGRATAIAYSLEGAKVALTYHSNREWADETAQAVRKNGGNPLVIRYDLSDESSMEETVKTVVDQWGTIDILVNNAVNWAPRHGGGPVKFEEVPYNEWRTMFRSSLEGVFLTTQLVAPIMRSNNWGRIINVSSNLAQDARGGQASYAAAKAGLHGLTRNLARELGPYGILTNVVMPGLTLTERPNRPLSEHIMTELSEMACTGRLTESHEVASLIVFLGSGANGHINGELIRVDGGL